MSSALLVITWALLLAVTQTTSMFECSETSHCTYDRLTCDANEDCTILCNGPNACNGATFICPASANQCNVICTKSNDNDTVFGCANVTIDASHSIGGSLSINASDKAQIMEGSLIKCPPFGSCDIHCHADNGCSSATIISHSETITLSVVASGNQVLQNSDITCPNSINSGDCSISAMGNYLHMMADININAQHSFNDVNLQCDYTTDVDTNCYDSECLPVIHCNANYSDSCSMQLITHSTNKWQCLSSISECAATLSTTMQTTTTQVEDGRDGEVITATTTTNTIMPPPDNGTRDKILLFVISNISSVVIIIGVIFCVLCCCIVWLICGYYKLKRNKTKEIKREEYNQYDGPRPSDTRKHMPLSINNDDEQYEYEYDEINQNKLVLVNMCKPKLKQNVPSTSSALQFEMRESISLASPDNRSNEHNLLNLAIEEHDIDDIQHQNVELCGLSEGDESGVGEKALFGSDSDNGSVEAMYDEEKHETLGGIAGNYDEEAEENENDQVFLGGLPKLTDIVSNEEQVEVEANINVNVTVETQDNNMSDMTPPFASTLNEPAYFKKYSSFKKYPSLPPESVQNSRTALIK